MTDEISRSKTIVSGLRSLPGGSPGAGVSGSASGDGYDRKQENRVGASDAGGFTAGECAGGCLSKCSVSCDGDNACILDCQEACEQQCKARAAGRVAVDMVEPNRVAMDNEGTPPGQSQCMRYPGWDNILPARRACCYT